MQSFFYLSYSFVCYFSRSALWSTLYIWFLIIIITFPHIAIDLSFLLFALFVLITAISSSILLSSWYFLILFSTSSNALISFKWDFRFNLFSYEQCTNSCSNNWICYVPEKNLSQLCVVPNKEIFFLEIVALLVHLIYNGQKWWVKSKLSTGKFIRFWYK